MYVKQKVVNQHNIRSLEKINVGVCSSCRPLLAIGGFCEHAAQSCHLHFDTVDCM
jgi:hypothetical protein